ncbi:MAG: hypothetical protein KAZ45_01555 [Arenimonas sp.]|nr:hypothetical protein [Arenimonas sp.]MBP7917132.1 hypothetical protein [Arenimonas sp.]
MVAKRAMELLELSIANPMQLFNSMDPAPFRERDLDVEVVAYIIEWAHDTARDAPLGLQVTLTRGSEIENVAAVLADAVHESFRQRASANRRKLRRMFRDGRYSLLIGLCFLTMAIFISDYIGSLISNESSAWLIQESVVIGGWVALWHPLNIFLYDWWPIRAEIRMYERLVAMEVRLQHAVDCGPSASIGSGAAA